MSHGPKGQVHDFTERIRIGNVMYRRCGVCRYKMYDGKAKDLGEQRASAVPTVSGPGESQKSPVNSSEQGS
jgi:hypothetical protein